MSAPGQARRAAETQGAEPLNLVRNLLLIALVPASLVAWLALYKQGCAALLCLLPAAALLYRFSMQSSLFHRRVVADAYAEPGSFVHALLRAPLRVHLASIASAAGLTVALFALVAAASPALLILLLLNPIAVLIFYLALDGLAPRLRLAPRYAELFAKRQVALVDGLLLFGAGIALRLFERVPAYVTESQGLAAALNAALEGVGSACPVIHAAVRIVAELDALQWAILAGATQSGSLPAVLGWAVWLSFLAGGGLVAAAASRASVEAVSLMGLGSKGRAHA